MSRLPIRLRLTLAFALAMAVVLAVAGALVYVRVDASLTEQLDESLDARAAALAPLAGSGEPLAPDRRRGARAGRHRSGERARLRRRRRTRARRRVHHRARGRRGVRGRARAPPPHPRRDRRRPARPRRRGVPRGARGGARRPARRAARRWPARAARSPRPPVTSSPVPPSGPWRRCAAALQRSRATSPAQRLPLPEANDEIRRLGTTLNEMLDRLEEGIERERRFTADASHELRTPLALLETTRLTLSTIVKTRKRRPSTRLSERKSRLQRSSGRVAGGGRTRGALASFLRRFTRIPSPSSR